MVGDFGCGEAKIAQTALYKFGTMQAVLCYVLDIANVSNTLLVEERLFASLNHLFGSRSTEMFEDNKIPAQASRYYGGYLRTVLQKFSRPRGNIKVLSYAR